MKLSITKMNYQDNLNVVRGLDNSKKPLCTVTIEGGNLNATIVKVATYLHVFQDFSLPEKHGNDLIYHCYNNDQVDNLVKHLFSWTLAFI